MHYYVNYLLFSVFSRLFLILVNNHHILLQTPTHIIVFTLMHYLSLLLPIVNSPLHNTLFLCARSQSSFLLSFHIPLYLYASSLPATLGFALSLIEPIIEVYLLLTTYYYLIISPSPLSLPLSRVVMAVCLCMFLSVARNSLHR